MSIRIKRFTYAQMVLAIEENSRFNTWRFSTRNNVCGSSFESRKPWKVARYTIRHPFVFA